ncbi:hypothetical protein [Bradyrhizobium cenepequi]
MGIGSDALKILSSIRSPLETSVISDRGDALASPASTTIVVHGSLTADDIVMGDVTVGDREKNQALSHLAEELSALQEGLRNRASETRDDDEVLPELLRLEQAKKATTDGDLLTAARHLGGAGRWVADFARSIGLILVPDAIMRTGPFSPLIQPQLKSVPIESTESVTIVRTERPATSPRRRLAQAPGKTRPTSNAIVVSSHFKLVFLSILAITLLSGAVQTAMAFTWLEPTKIQQDVFDAMGFAWKLCLGAIVGLLGGKAIK